MTWAGAWLAVEGETGSTWAGVVSVAEKKEIRVSSFFMTGIINS
jgi:hypothetical protein